MTKAYRRKGLFRLYRFRGMGVRHHHIWKPGSRQAVMAMAQLEFHIRIHRQEAESTLDTKGTFEVSMLAPMTHFLHEVQTS